MTLLTSNILQQIKDEFNLRMTWNLGVVQLKFRVEDGAYELHRKVPFDYDSEYQDIYSRIAMALVRGQITVHEGLIYQSEAKKGIHTAGSGLFIRDFPGRLILYPFQASMCAMIFFNGKWIDAGVAAMCGFAAGLVEYGLSSFGGQAKVLIDVVVGLSTGVIGGLWMEHVNGICLPAVFLGTLYWFFYGTAFVIGLLEIIAGELETGVTRFVAVSVKTFVLSLGASLGLLVAVQGNALDTWQESEGNCSSGFTDEWWRIPVYLLCSVGVLGQYRIQFDRYWCALVVQFVAYEVQYKVFRSMDKSHDIDHLDTALSNIAGCATGVLCACALSSLSDIFRKFYSARLLNRDEPANTSCLSDTIYRFMRFTVKAYNCLGLNRKSEIEKLDLEMKIKDQHAELNNPSHPRERIDLEWRDEELFLETVVSSQDINIWSILMPAVYQLVPGSVIAKFWFVSIFPEEPGSDSTNTKESVFANLMVISTSLALGLIFGFAIVQTNTYFYGRVTESCFKVSDEAIELRKRRQNTMEGMYTAGESPDDDPEAYSREFAKRDNKAE